MKIPNRQMSYLQAFQPFFKTDAMRCAHNERRKILLSLFPIFRSGTMSACSQRSRSVLRRSRNENSYSFCPLPSAFCLIFKTDFHKHEHTIKNKNSSFLLPTPYSLLPIFRLGLKFVPSIIVLVSLLLNACSNKNTKAETKAEKQTIGIVLDTGGENDKSFNEYTIKGAREGAKASGLNFFYLVSGTSSDYEKNIELEISEGANLIVTVGFLMGDATAAMAKKYPNVKFAIIDNAYFPGKDGVDPYAKDLKNVTSLMFAEDQVGYLAGVLAGCVSQTGKVATVSGMEIPPVKNFVVGFQKGAKSLHPKIVTFNQYIPDFNDPATGKTVGQSFINQGADVIFGVGGNTGNGGLLAAKEAGKKAIGVDVDQYFTYREIKEALITSATKRMDVATLTAIKKFAQGKLKPGIELATLSSKGVSLAPYHDWDSKIPQTCKDKVKAAEIAIRNNPKITRVN